MKCKKCNCQAVFLNPQLCRKHFLYYVEKKVDATITKYKLITKKDKIVVGVSGGKDSLSILYLLRKYTKNIVAVCIDEGIEGYRPETIKDMEAFCQKYKIQYVIVSFEKVFGKPLDVMKTFLKEKPCTICGTFRRYLLNKTARKLGATKLVTGHNLDDESQAILMNLFRHQLDILPRLGPVTGVNKEEQFIPRIKPLYFLAEKEIAAYAFLQDFGIKYVECPNALRAYRAEVGEVLHDVEALYPHAKQNLVEWFMKKKKVIPSLKVQIQHCQNCQEPSAGKYCKTCQLLMKLETRYICDDSLYKNR